MFSVLSALAQVFAPHIERLCGLIAHHGNFHRADMPVVEIAWHRLHRLLRRLDALASRFEAGALPPPRAARPRKARAPAKPAEAAAPAAPPPPAPWGVEWEFGPPWGPPRPVMPPPAAPVRVPAGDGWVRRLSWTTNCLTAHFERALAHPDTLALVAAVPQAGRLLRPLCRMMGVAVPAAMRLARRPRVRKPREPEPASPIVKRPDIPLRPGWAPVPQRLRTRWMKAPKRLRAAPSG